MPEHPTNFQDLPEQFRRIKRKSGADLLLPERQIDRIIEMAWEDRTPFEAIEQQFGLSESEVIVLMRRELKPGSWRNWRARVSGRATKHAATRSQGASRFKSDRQRTISKNKISKRP